MSDATQQEILQRQALAQALMQKGLAGGPQGQMISGHYVGPGIGALLPLAQVMAGQKIGNAANAQMQGYEQTQREGLQKDLSSFLGQLRGSPGTPMGPPDESGNMGVTGAVPADPYAALVGALTSKHPEMQGIGKTMLPTILGPKTPEKFGHDPKYLVGPDGKRTAVLVGDAGTVKPVTGFTPDTKLEATGQGQVWNPYTGEAKAYLGEKYGPTTMVNGEAVRFEERSGKPAQVANRPAQTKVTAAVNTGEDAYLKKRGGDKAELAGKVETSARAATDILRNVAQLRELDAKGTFSNPTAEAATFLSQIGQALGLPAQDAKTANSEAYRAEVRNLLISSMQQLGGAKGLSEKETQLVLEAFPNLDRSPQARQILFSTLERKAQQAQVEYKRLLETERAAYPSQGMLGYDFSSTPGATAPGVVPVVPPAQGVGKPTITKSGW